MSAFSITATPSDFPFQTLAEVLIQGYDMMDLTIRSAGKRRAMTNCIELGVRLDGKDVHVT